MATLTSEREKAQLEPVTEAQIEFVGVEEGVELVSSVIKEFGTVGSTGIFAEQSMIEMPTGSNHHQINQAYSFKVILVDQKGNQTSSEMMRQSIKDLAVEVSGPSKVKVNALSTKKVILLFAYI